MHQYLKTRELFIFAKDIKLTHSVFALPFVFVGILISPIEGLNLKQFVLIIFSMVFARSFAMGANRYLDRSIDAKNPRTKERALAKKALSPKSSLQWTLIFGAAFMCTTLFFNLKTFFLSLPLLVVLASYSLTKRFTFLCHIYLGMCLALSPIAASIALTGDYSIQLIFLFFAILFWTAGFDIIYATQDINFDQKHNLHSIPAKFGIKTSMILSSLFFLLMILFLIACGLWIKSSYFFYFGIFIISCILFYEIILLNKICGNKHSQVSIDKIFFDMNAVVSLLFYAFVHLDILFKS